MLQGGGGKQPSLSMVAAGDTCAGADALVWHPQRSIQMLPPEPWLCCTGETWHAGSTCVVRIQEHIIAGLIVGAQMQWVTRPLQMDTHLQGI